MHVVVIGGGVAGVAAAVAVARQGARTTLFERSQVLGGVAVRGGHRTLCGLSAIDAPQPELLEPALTAAWIPLLAAGEAERQGRVWLWPTRPEVLIAGLNDGLRAAGVEVHLGQPVTIDAAGQVFYGETIIQPHAVIDATGTAIGPGARRMPQQLGAWRVEVEANIEDSPAGRRQALRAIARLAPGAALTHLEDKRWQLSLDLPAQSMADLNAVGEAAAAVLSGRLVTAQCSLANRDDGGYAGLSLAALFATQARGLAWAAWPSELHTPAGIQWTWPPRERHGLPHQLVKPDNAPAWLWCCGKGLAATPEAAGALRVTGTALALGSALGHLVVQT